MVVDVTREVGTVSQSGTVWSASNMNDLENRINSAFSEVNSDLANKLDKSNMVTDICDNGKTLHIQCTRSILFMYREQRTTAPFKEGLNFISSYYAKRIPTNFFVCGTEWVGTITGNTTDGYYVNFLASDSSGLYFTIIGTDFTYYID